MSQTANNVSGGVITERNDRELELRIFRVMIVTVVAAAIVATVFASGRISFGVMLGGGLSLLNYHWLRTSVGAILNIDYALERPRIRISSYILRYLFIGIVVFAAYQLRWVSLAATIAGLCSFVPALFVEALRQFYFAIIHREESY